MLLGGTINKSLPDSVYPRPPCRGLLNKWEVAVILFPGRLPAFWDEYVKSPGFPFFVFNTVLRISH